MMNKVKLLWSKTNRWHRGLLLFILLETRWLPGGMIGFKCNDPALSFEFTGDTITEKHLFGSLFLLPLGVMLLVERKYHTTGKSIALYWYKEYLYGMLINLNIVEGLKVIVGAPRPHFFDTCSPKEAATCEGSEYVSHYTCTKSHWLTQSNTSFPSGHTALGVHLGLFLIYYLQQRAKRSNKVLTAQIVLCLISVYCGVSRMTDHRHHWWDVLAGAVLGLPIIVYTIVYLCNNFIVPEDRELKQKSSESSNNDHHHHRHHNDDDDGHDDCDDDGHDDCDDDGHDDCDDDGHDDCDDDGHDDDDDDYNSPE